MQYKNVKIYLAVSAVVAVLFTWLAVNAYSGSRMLAVVGFAILVIIDLNLIRILRKDLKEYRLLKTKFTEIEIGYSMEYVVDSYSKNRALYYFIKDWGEYFTIISKFQHPLKFYGFSDNVYTAKLLKEKQLSD